MERRGEREGGGRGESTSIQTFSSLCFPSCCLAVLRLSVVCSKSPKSLSTRGRDSKPRDWRYPTWSRRFLRLVNFLSVAVAMSKLFLNRCASFGIRWASFRIIKAMAEDVPLALYLPAGLFLKPDPKVTIEVKLPDMKQMGVSVSNWEVMEKIRVLSLPEVYVSLRVVNYSRDIVHFEGELESVKSLRKVLLLIDKKSIKLSGFSDTLKVKVQQKEVPHPSKQEWEDYFADQGMDVFDDERPGERPDTLHIRGLPAKWFISRTSDGGPCQRVLTQAFQKFGRVREVGIYEPTPETSSFSSFGPGMRVALHFEAFIQYEKYSAFCNAMQSLKGMKLIRLEDGGKEGMAIIQADFDRGAYLSSRNIRRRRRAEERQRKIEEEKERRENEKLKKEEVQQEELKKKAEEERAVKKALKLEAKQKKRDEEARLVAELKAVAVSRREEAQRLLRVMLAGAAETK